MLREGGWAPLLSVGGRLVALGAHVVDAQLLVLLEAALVALHPQLRVLLRGVHVLRGREKPPEPPSPPARGGRAPDPITPAPVPSTSCPSGPRQTQIPEFPNPQPLIPNTDTTATIPPPNLPAVFLPYEVPSFPMYSPSLHKPPKNPNSQQTRGKILPSYSEHVRMSECTPLYLKVAVSCWIIHYEVSLGLSLYYLQKESTPIH